MKIFTSKSNAQSSKLDVSFAANSKLYFRLNFMPTLFLALILLPLIGCSAKRSVPIDKKEKVSTISISSISDFNEIPFESKVLLELKNGASKKVRYMGVVTEELENQIVDYVQWSNIRGSVLRTIPVDEVSHIVVLKRKKNGFIVNVIVSIVEILF